MREDRTRRKAERVHTEFTFFVNQLCRVPGCPSQRMRNHTFSKAKRVHTEFTLFVNSTPAGTEGVGSRELHENRPMMEASGNDRQGEFTQRFRFL